MLILNYTSPAPLELLHAPPGLRFNGQVNSWHNPVLYCLDKYLNPFKYIGLAQSPLKFDIQK